MSYVIHSDYVSTLNANGTRNVSDIKFATIHYNANPGSSTKNNSEYYATTPLNGVSMHWFVGDDGCWSIIPETMIAGHEGRWSGTEYLTESRNFNSIGIETTCLSMSGKKAKDMTGYEDDIYWTDNTYKNLVELTRDVVKRYGIPRANVLRHFDIHDGKKRCPIMFVNEWNVYYKRSGEDMWKEFLDNVFSGSNIIKVPTKDGMYRYYDEQRDGWTDDPTSKPLNPTYKQWTAEVTHITQDDYLNVRTGAGASYPNLPSYPRLALGNRVDVVSEALADDGRIWFQIRIAGKYYGYVRSDYLQPLTEIKIAKVDHVQRLIVRSAPVVKQSSVYKPYNYLGLGNYVEVLDSSDRFFDRIRFRDQKGGYHIAYASRYYLERV